jgi:hypothetical protein
MKALKFEILTEYHPDFSWFIIPTIEINNYEKGVELSWLCFSITITKSK